MIKNSELNTQVEFKMVFLETFQFNMRVVSVRLFLVEGATRYDFRTPCKQSNFDLDDFIVD